VQKPQDSYDSKEQFTGSSLQSW